MKSFKNYLKEEYISIKKLFVEELLIEAAGASADTKGKLRELEIGQHLNGGVHMDSYRAEGKSPEEMHTIHSIKAHGENFEKIDSYKKSQELARNAAKGIKKHIKKVGLGDVKRTVWTSQDSDHESETGVKDPNTSADLILTTSNTHKRKNDTDGKERNENKVAVSVKTGGGSVNYSNPGLSSMGKLAGKDLKDLTRQHSEVIKGNLPEGRGDSHTKYKSLRDSTSIADQSKAAEIKHSSERLNNDVAHHIRQNLAKSSHEQLQESIMSSVAPKTHLKHIVSRQLTHKVTGEELSHHTYDLHEHVNEYLSQFHGLHVDPNLTGSSVTVHGFNKKTGKKMTVARYNVHAGGRPANTSPRGSVVLPSEDHKDISYSEKSEHMEH